MEPNQADSYNLTAGKTTGGMELPGPPLLDVGRQLVLSCL